MLVAAERVGRHLRAPSNVWEALQYPRLSTSALTCHQVYADFRKQAAHTFDVVNTQLDNTEELLLVAKGANDSHPVDFLTHFRFGDECASGSLCAYNLTKASYFEDTVQHCANGTGQGNDYRNRCVRAAFLVAARILFLYGFWLCCACDVSARSMWSPALR